MSQNRSEVGSRGSATSEALKPPPLADKFAVVSCFMRLNPARMKSVNVLEQDRHDPDPDSEIHWVVSARIVMRALASQCREARIAFRARYMRLEGGLHVNDIAKALKKSRRTIHRWIDDIWEDIEKKAIIARLIPEPPKLPADNRQ